MPAILVASKMKSGLPKPVHSAAPILHVPTARTIPQPCYLKFGNKVEVTKPLYSSQIPLKSSNGQENTGDGLPARKSGSVENGFDTQRVIVVTFCRDTRGTVTPRQKEFQVVTFGDPDQFRVQAIKLEIKRVLGSFDTAKG
ncbi:hypothetical protein DUI87_25625 [Hirundo rustica rustica]|uniref:Uncharacterized protein n=1 Tax=Hirundo rustica rustica TaxID=333673 RepID=A0A3M0JB29_HIRRU|nr:hypothetical protein DUI87_25625 [Hirundo rustica rustica]